MGECKKIFVSEVGGKLRNKKTRHPAASKQSEEIFMKSKAKAKEKAKDDINSRK